MDQKLLGNSELVLHMKYTCKELHTVNSQANTVVFSLTANSPNTQVIPRSGSRITVLFTAVLGRRAPCCMLLQNQNFPYSNREGLMNGKKLVNISSKDGLKSIASEIF